MNAPEDAARLVTFRIEEQWFAVYLANVERVIRAVEVINLPETGKLILGALNLQGEAIPVLDIRTLFGTPSRDIDIEDQMIIIRTPKRKLAVLVDAVGSVTEPLNIKVEGITGISSGSAYISAISETEKGTVIVLKNLENLLENVGAQELKNAVGEKEQ